MKKVDKRVIIINYKNKRVKKFDIKADAKT